MILRNAGALLILATGLACGADDDAADSADNSARAGDFIGAQPPGGGPVFEDEGTTAPPPGSTPASFTSAERGAWGLGSEVPAGAELGPVLPAEGRQSACGTVLTGVVRDLPESHPDFGGDISGLQRGLVQRDLGADGNPVLSDDYADGFIQSPQSFAEWYETVPGENIPFYLSLSLEERGDTFGFESDDFFPLDGEGFGNENEDRNFYFTFELHTRFRYAGGEVFRFAGDDDLWVFINGRLAIDLGGVHGEEDETIQLDAEALRLGIEPGNEYALDFFQAERHVTESNFQIETTLEFTNCGATVLR
jgi:fibro-slime domain-containing protein